MSNLIEERVLQRLFCRDAFGRVIREQLFDEVAESGVRQQLRQRLRRGHGRHTAARTGTLGPAQATGVQMKQ